MAVYFGKALEELEERVAPEEGCSMNKLAKLALDQGLALNHRMSGVTANSLDWLFKRDTLIKSGRTWFELVHDGDLMSVRYYELPDEDEIGLVDGSTMPIRREQHPVPLVLVPPLGVTTETFDLMPQRSLVRYLVARGFKVYLLDWGKPKKEHAHLGMLDYCEDMMGTALDKVRRHSGSKELSLMGWCMGGLFCLFYQGIVKDRSIRNIVTIASPIDLETGQGCYFHGCRCCAGAGRAGSIGEQLHESSSQYAKSRSLVYARLGDHNSL